jgi:class 3 adenylate cyclase
MVFVNEIAEIVHGTVDHYSGSANKNIGDAFLLVWKFQPTDFGPDETNPKMLKLKSSFQIQ